MQNYNVVLRVFILIAQFRFYSLAGDQNRLDAAILIDVHVLIVGPPLLLTFPKFTVFSTPSYFRLRLLRRTMVSRFNLIHSIVTASASFCMFGYSPST